MNLDIEKFLDQAEETIGRVILLSFDTACAPRETGWAQDLSTAINQGKFSSQLFSNDRFSDFVDPNSNVDAHPPASLVSADELLAGSMGCQDLGDFLTAMLSGHPPFGESAYREDHDLPRYSSFHRAAVHSEAARTLSLRFLQAIEVPHDSDFLMLNHRIFEEKVLLPVLKAVASSREHSFFFWNLHNDSVLLFGHQERLFLMMTTGSD